MNPGRIMRLPTLSHQQQRTEDAREFHERVYMAFLRAQQPFNYVREDRIFMPCDRRYLSAMAKMVSDGRHRFWLSRGFRLRCKQALDGSGFYVWLEAQATQNEAAA